MRLLLRHKAICFTFFLLALVYLNLLYMTGRTVGGNANWMVYPSSVFGIPDEVMREQGMALLFDNGRDLGWDGQFYYYMSNDLLGTKDTPQHIDSPSYRYQRIGIPLLTAIAAKLTFQTVPSVMTFVFVQLCLLGGDAIF